MSTLTFIGRAHSPNMLFSIDFIPSITWTMHDTGEQWFFKTTIVNSRVEVVCNVEQYRSEHFHSIYARAHDLVSACLDLGAFATATPVTLLFDEVILPSGARGPLWIADPSLARLCTTYRLAGTGADQGRRTVDMMYLLLEDYALAKALNDLTQVLQSQTQTAINCGRVIDGLRKIEAPTAPKSHGWRHLRSILNVDEEYIAFISRKSSDPRHGDRTIPGPQESYELMSRTWKCMNRYLEFRIRGRETLTVSEFPMLLG